MNELNINEWLDNLKKYEPEVADFIRRQIESGEEVKSPALMWLKARRSVHAEQYIGASFLASTKLDGRRS